MAEKPVSVRIGVVGADKVKAEFTAIASEGKRAFQVIEGGGRSSGAALQNVGFQVQDFAVQVAGGTDASRALAQQLPQLLSGLGLLGVGLGTAAAVVVPLISGFLSSGDAAKQLADDIDTLHKSSRDYQAAMDDALQPMDKLREKYGQQAAAVREVLTARLALAQFDFQSELTNTISGLDQSMTDLVDLVARINDMQARLKGVDEEAMPAGFAMLSQDVYQLAEDFGLTIDQANALVAALDQLRDAKGPAEQAAALEAIRKATEDSAGSTDHVTGALREAVRQATDMELKARDLAAQLGISVEQAQALADTDVGKGIRGAADSALTLVSRIDAALTRADNAAAMIQGGFSDIPRPKARPSGQGFTISENLALGLPWDTPDTPSKGSKGGGSAQKQLSEAQKEENDLLREAKRVFDQTRTSAEKYAIEQTKLNVLLAKGAIDQETYSRAIRDLKEKFNEAGKAGREMADEVGAALKDIIIKGGDANEVISQLLSSFASSLFDKGWTGLMNSIFPNANGNAFDGGVVQAFASGGVVSRPTLFGMKSGLGLMGEAGPEAILPLRRINGKLGVMAGGTGGDGVTVNVSINVDASGAVEGVADQVQRAVRAEVPGIVRQAVAGVGAARRRGYPT